MRPVAGPDAAVGGGLDIGARDRNDVVPGRAGLRGLFAERQHHPEIALREQLQHLAQVRVFLAAHRVGAGHVVDQHGHVEVFVLGDAGDDAVLLRLDLCVPAEFANSRDGAGEILVRQHRAEFLPETEARAAHAGVMKLGEIGVIGFGKHQRVGAAAIVRPHRGEGVEHHGMIGAIGRGLHDDAALDAERLVDAQRGFPGRGRHPVGGAGPHRIFVQRAQHVKLAVDALRRRRLEGRRGFGSNGR